MGYVGGDAAGLQRGGGHLLEVASSTRSAGAALDECVSGCAAALDGPLAEELSRLAAALGCFTAELAVHVETTGWLASHVGEDLARAGGAP